MPDLKETLESFYRTYDFKGRLRRDPIEFPHRYKNARDIEVVSFISTCFAYGKVDLFKPVIERILSPMGKSPHDFLHDFDPKKQSRLFTGIKYRFNENEDIIALLFILHRLIARFDSIEAVFRKHVDVKDLNIGNGLAGLMETIRSMDTSVVYGNKTKPSSLMQLFPSPLKGSACKRPNLFLRWMIRDKDIDFGIWKGIPTNMLVIPLDTHIAKISRCLGFTKRKASDWKTAVEITDALKRFDREDPLKYDFALCHHGISGVCKGIKGEGCSGCVLKPYRPDYRNPNK